MKKRLMFSGVCAAAILLLAPNNGTAQSFTVDYFGAADQSYEFVNYGFHGANEFDAASYECANIYVFSFQDPVACGSCFVSPNGSLHEDLNTNLRAFPVTGVVPTVGVIKVVYTQFTTNFCDPTAVTAPSPGLKTFRTRGTSEIELDEVPLSGAELAHLNGTCSDIFAILSGTFNITCGPSDPHGNLTLHNSQRGTGK
ncbi:MAG: hypothetical protein JO033_02005 [Acidobacteriaceae bacterium]|nr:hypothetical protein [Acidobacteriaceae bacterium]